MIMHSLEQRVIQFVSLFYVLAIIAIILLANRSGLPCWITWYNDIPYGDAIGHFILFGVFSMAVTIGFRFKKITVCSRKLFLGTVITFLFVTAEEFSQQFIPSRNFSLLDLSASYLGIWSIGQRFSIRLFNTRVWSFFLSGRESSDKKLTSSSS